MNKHAIYHLADSPWAYGIGEGKLRVRIRVGRDDMKKVTLYYKDRYQWGGKYEKLDLKIMARQELFDFYYGDMELPRARFRYFFLLEDKRGNKEIYDDIGFRPYEEEGFEYRAFQFAYLASNDFYRGKENLKNAIVYQIFPERFKNGDKANDPENTLKWGGIPKQGNFFGGDLRGIIEGLSYLSDLGVNMIYLTPIFLSSSNHKYNIKDYYSIDPQFGSIEDAKELVKRAHEFGIKVIFDAVFNHTGDDFFAFSDIKEKGDKSKYLDWYHIDSLPIDSKEVNYYTFAEKIYSMPKLRTENDKVREYFFEVGKYWIKEVGIDGWRLDVCDEVDHNFWQGFKKACESVNEDAVLIGEIMHEASSFLRGNELDSIMNYQFKNALTEYFAKRTLDINTFIDVLENIRTRYIDDIGDQLWNLIGSHDTPRFLTESKGQVDRLLLAVAFQFIWPGVPYIYYGDEVGLDGGQDPYCRACMLWDEAKWDKRILNFYKALISFRKENNKLNDSPLAISNIDGLIVVKRLINDEEYIFIFNNMDEERLYKNKAKIKEISPCNMEGEVILEREVKGNVSLAPMSFRFFKGVLYEK